MDTQRDTMTPDESAAEKSAADFVKYFLSDHCRSASYESHVAGFIAGCKHRDAKIADLIRVRLWAEEHGIPALKRFASIEASDGDNFEGVHEDVIIRVEVTAGDIQSTRDALFAFSAIGPAGEMVASSLLDSIPEEKLRKMIEDEK